MYSNPHHCGFFSVEWELLMSIINLSFVMLDETVCLSNLPVQPPGNIWYFKVKAFTLKHLDPNLPIASTINTGARQGQNTAGQSAALFTSHDFCGTAVYFQAWADVHACGTRCRTGVKPKKVAFGGDWLRCPQPRNSLGSKEPEEMVWTNLLLKAGIRVD